MFRWGRGRSASLLPEPERKLFAADLAGPCAAIAGCQKPEIAALAVAANKRAFALSVADVNEIAFT